MASIAARLPRPLGIVVKNALFLALVGGLWLALDTGYFTPDRPTRAQWTKLEKAKDAKAQAVVYQSDFAKEQPGGAGGPAGVWGPYNYATPHTITFDAGGFTINYKNSAWLGAVFDFRAYEPRTIYRVTIERETEGQSAALLVRNRQMDLLRARIPVGKGTYAVEFISPRGSRDRTYVILMPNRPNDPQGRMRVTSVKIEKIGSADD